MTVTSHGTRLPEQAAIRHFLPGRTEATAAGRPGAAQQPPLSSRMSRMSMSLQYGPWSNIAYITPSPEDHTKKNISSASAGLQEKLTWEIIYGSSGYNVFLTTNPKGTWYWNQSTPTQATARSAVIKKYRGSNLKKYTNYYFRIVTRRRRNGVFCTVPMPAADYYTGSFRIN